MKYLRIVVLVLYCVAGSTVHAQDGLDTISFHEVFSETYSGFMEDHSVWVRQSRSYADSVKAGLRHVGMDSIYLEDGQVVATGVVLYYQHDTLTRLTFYLSTTEDEKFLRAIGKGVFARLGRQGKARKFKSGGERYYYRRNMIPWKEREAVEWGYGVGRW